MHTVSTSQFLDSNGLRAYPFIEDAVMGPDNGARPPEWAVVDAFVCVRDGVSSTEPVCLVSFHAGPGVVSAVFSCGGRPVCMCSVDAGSLEPYRPYPMTQVAGSGACGCCSFGDVKRALSASGEKAVGLRFAGVPLLSSQVVHIDPAGVVRFVDGRSGDEVSGNVRMWLGDGIEATLSRYSNGDGEDVSKVSMNVDNSLAAIVAMPCYKPWNNVDYVNSIRPIKSINGVPVGGSGLFQIVFTTRDIANTLVKKG